MKSRQIESAHERANEAHRPLGPGVVLVERQRPLGINESLAQHLRSAIFKKCKDIHAGPHGICLRKNRIQFDRAAQKRFGRRRVVLSGQTLSSLEEIVVGGPILCRLASRFVRAVGSQSPHQGSNNSVCYLILDGKDVLKLSIVALSPEVCPGGNLDQLSRDANASAGPAHAPFNYVGYSEVLPDSFHVYRPVAVLERRIPSNDQ